MRPYQSACSAVISDILCLAAGQEYLDTERKYPLTITWALRSTITSGITEIGVYQTQESGVTL